MLGLCLLLLVVVRNPWLLALDAAALGLVSGQLGFQLNDPGHKQMFDRNSLNDLTGSLTGRRGLRPPMPWLTRCSKAPAGLALRARQLGAEAGRPLAGQGDTWHAPKSEIGADE